MTTTSLSSFWNVDDHIDSWLPLTNCSVRVPDQQILFYSILCSGLTAKTKLFFLSSNSSFSECVRPSTGFHLFQQYKNENTPLCTINAIPATSDQCKINQRNILSQNSAYKFTFCSFSHLAGGNTNGGAITFTSTVQKTSSSLEVSYTTFSDCSANEGGAIHASTIQKITVTQSLFLRCSSSNTADNTGGGGINIDNIKITLSISNNNFISCTAKASGGCICIRSCSANTKKIDAINSCRFINCHATDTLPDGAGVCVWGTEELIGVMSSLFSLCSTSFGGALFYYLYNYRKSAFPIRYCFLNANTGTFGSDLAIWNYLPKTEADDYALLFHCFSTSASYRIGYYYNQIWSKTDANWLFKGVLKYHQLFVNMFFINFEFFFV